MGAPHNMLQTVGYNAHTPPPPRNNHVLTRERTNRPGGLHRTPAWQSMRTWCHSCRAPADSGINFDSTTLRHPQRPRETAEQAGLEAAQHTRLVMQRQASNARASRLQRRAKVQVRSLGHAHHADSLCTSHTGRVGQSGLLGFSCSNHAVRKLPCATLWSTLRACQRQQPCSAQSCCEPGTLHPVCGRRASPTYASFLGNSHVNVTNRKKCGPGLSSHGSGRG